MRLSTPRAKDSAAWIFDLGGRNFFIIRISSIGRATFRQEYGRYYSPLSDPSLSAIHLLSMHKKTQYFARKWWSSTNDLFSSLTGGMVLYLWI